MNLFAGGDGASPLGGALDIIGSLVGGGSPGGSSGTQSTSSKGTVKEFLQINPLRLLLQLGVMHNFKMNYYF